ncbi:MAG: protein translocase subunit SecF [Micavibrio sp.]|nr:protein translocase subunit SecF [Micavibrio sp.]
MKPLRLIPDATNIDFIKVRFFTFLLSACLVMAAFGLLFTKGLNFGIDFVGGTLIEVKLDQAPNMALLRDDFNNLNIGAISLQEFGEADDLLIRVPEQAGGIEDQQKAVEDVRTVLAKQYGEEAVEYRRTEFVGPQVGKELIRAGGMAVLFSLLGIMAYVSVRFEWQFGAAALIALFHDTMITIGFFSLTGMEFNLATVAAVLMVGGYSINDTVVVFDRIRENMRKFKKMDMRELLNVSVNQTLSRTVLTSFTTLLALFALWFFGGEVIRGFTLALIVGIGVGTYSSIFVAGALLVYFNIRTITAKEDKAAA